MTQASDYINTREFYRIPRPFGEQESADLDAAILEGERLFTDTFGMQPAPENMEAVKFFVFANWLRWQTLRKTSAGASAKIDFTQAQNRADETRRITAWNRACELVGRTDRKLHKIFNY